MLLPNRSFSHNTIKPKTTECFNFKPGQLIKNQEVESLNQAKLVRSKPELLSFKYKFCKYSRFKQILFLYLGSYPSKSSYRKLKSE